MYIYIYIFFSIIIRNSLFMKFFISIIIRNIIYISLYNNLFCLDFLK